MQLEECVNYLLTTAQHSVFLKMTEKLSAFDPTPIQYAVLYCLWENDRRSPKGSNWKIPRYPGFWSGWRRKT